jgi:hypothetical protein
MIIKMRKFIHLIIFISLISINTAISISSGQLFCELFKSYPTEINFNYDNNNVYQETSAAINGFLVIYLL